MMETIIQSVGVLKCETRSDILQGQALFRRVKQLLTLGVRGHFLTIWQKWRTDREAEINADRRKDRQTERQTCKQRDERDHRGRIFASLYTIITSTLGTWASNSSGSFDPPNNVSSINVLVNLNKLGFRKEIFSIIMLPGVVNDT